MHVSRRGTITLSNGGGALGASSQPQSLAQAALFAADASADLASGQPDAQQAGAALANAFDDKAPAASRSAAAAAAAALAFGRTKQGEGWDTAAWRECFVLGSCCAALLGSRGARQGESWAEDCGTSDESLDDW